MAVTTIRVGPEDGYPDGTEFHVSLTPTVIHLDSSDGTSTPIVAQSIAIRTQQTPTRPGYDRLTKPPFAFDMGTKKR